MARHELFAIFSAHCAQQKDIPLVLGTNFSFQGLALKTKAKMLHRLPFPECLNHELKVDTEIFLKIGREMTLFMPCTPG